MDVCFLNRPNCSGAAATAAAAVLAAPLLPFAIAESRAQGGEAVPLPPIVISASATPVAAREVGSAVTVITGEEIERLQIRSLAEVLRKVPGVSVNRAGNAGALTQVRIRGAEGNHTLVLIDGIEVNDPAGESEFNFGTLVAADIERVEVLRGPQSALYGSEAIGGVINIVTKRGEGAATLAGSAEGGSFYTASGDASLRGGGDWYHFSIGATGFRTDGQSVAPEDQGNSENDGSRSSAFNAKLGVTPLPNLEVDLVGRFVSHTVETDPQPAVAGPIVTVDGDDWTKTFQRGAGAQAKYTLFDGAWENIAGVGYHQTKSDSYEDKALSFSSIGEKTKLRYQSNLFFDTPEIADASHTLTFLAEREYESQETASAFGGSDLDITNDGYVGEYRVDLWDRLFLSGSVRFDDNELFDNSTTYRATAAYLHEETGTRMHGSYGTGVKNPTLFELFGFGPSFVPNPNLEPEKSKGFDIGVEQGFWGDRASVDLTYFNNRITDLIQGAGNSAVNLNGTSRVQGVELSGRLEPLAGLTFSGQYTYTLGRDANGEELLRRPKHMASLNAAYTFLEGRATLDLGVDYGGARNDVQFSDFFATRSVVRLDDFVKVDVAASYQLTDSVQLYGRVENLLNDQYEEVLGYAATGIGAYAGLKVRFGVF